MSYLRGAGPAAVVLVMRHLVNRVVTEALSRGKCKYSLSQYLMLGIWYYILLSSFSFWVMNLKVLGKHAYHLQNLLLAHTAIPTLHARPHSAMISNGSR